MYECVFMSYIRECVCFVTFLVVEPTLEPKPYVTVVKTLVVK